VKTITTGDLTVLRPSIQAFALLSTGLLSGAFGYGAVNVAYAFRVVPLDVRFTFHTALMQVNGVVMQTTMALAILSSVVLAIVSRRLPRLLAAGAAVLALTSFLVTRFVNGLIKRWAVGPVPADHAAILQRWETFHVVRTSAAFVAFLLVIVVVVAGDRLMKSRTGPVPAV
jgi:hypothetical protein